MQSLHDELRDLRDLLEAEIDIAGPVGLVPADTTKAPPEKTAKKPSTKPDSMDQEPIIVDDQRRGAKTQAVESRKREAPANPLPETKPASGIAARIAADSVLHSFSTLDALEAYVADTVLIPLDETRLNPVFGVGNDDADVMVVGEAPGADEDEQGEPFVGRAGQLLNKILAAVDFSRDEVYIANILKSRPPKNRNPLPDEIAAHIPILYKQIELINPRIILCVGKIAATTLLEINSSLGSMRGKVHDLSGFPVVVTYHPAALLRNPNWKKPTWEDVQYLRAQYDELAASDVSNEVDS